MREIRMISVVICTRNRAQAIKKCLSEFEGMKVPIDLTWELIVVDNNSVDETKDVIMAFLERSNLPLIYKHENRRGSSNARNTGIGAARGEIIAFTDDDCIVTPDWLSCIAHEFRSDPTLSGVGGRVELYDIRDKPFTIRTSLTRSLFSSTDQVFGYIPGCNMAFVREVFDQIGNFDGRFGAGTPLKAAEDSDFVYRVYKNGFKMLYSPEVCVYHNHGRRTDHQVKALKRNYEIGKGAFYCKHIFNGDINVLKQAYWEITSALRLIKDILVGTSYYMMIYCKGHVYNKLSRLNR